MDHVAKTGQWPRVRWERIDVERAGALIDRSVLLVAHNARFDRPFVEWVLPAARRQHARLAQWIADTGDRFDLPEL